MSTQKQICDSGGEAVKSNEEMWKSVPIPGLEHLYEISNKGTVKSLSKIVRYKDGRVFKYPGKAMKARINNGYYQIHLCYGNRVYISKDIHRLVALAFIDNPNNKPYVNHIDGDKLNNSWVNLEWVTAHENSIHAVKTGLCTNFVGENNPLSKLTPLQISLIRKSYENGFDIKGICQTFDISERHAVGIIKKERWKHVS